MLKIGILFALFSTGFSWAEDDDDVGKVSYVSVGKASHDGDFIKFSLDFEAKCYDDAQSPRAIVIENVKATTEWLKASGANITQNIDLINVSRNGLYPEDCSYKYNAQQSVIITLKKGEGEASINTLSFQQFFNDLQTLLAPGNYTLGELSLTSVTSRIIAIEKGLLEETANALELEAMTKAQEKATRNFKAFLGPNYRGWWHLHAANFGNHENPGYISWGGQGPLFERSVGNSGNTLVYSDLKLEPITLTIEGKFLFHYKMQNNYLAHH